jgi:hypothetical protein
MSTGAWIFSGIIGAAIIAPAGVYAAVSSTVAIGNPSNGTTATVDGASQLLTNASGPKNMVEFEGQASAGNCGAVYTPPAGKAIVLTEVTADLGTGTVGQESYAYLGHANCNDIVDFFDTTQGYEAQSRNYPAGLPISSVGVLASGSAPVYISGVGYLIPAAQLPAAQPAGHLPALKRMKSASH